MATKLLDVDLRLVDEFSAKDVDVFLNFDERKLSRERSLPARDAELLVKALRIARAAVQIEPDRRVSISHDLILESVRDLQSFFFAYHPIITPLFDITRMALALMSGNECQMESPYAPMRLVRKSGGRFYWTCTHQPPHETQTSV